MTEAQAAELIQISYALLWLLSANVTGLVISIVIRFWKD